MLNARHGRPGLRWLVVLFALVLFASACGSDDKEEASTGSDGTSDEEDAGDAPTNTDPIKIGVVVPTTGTFSNFGIGEKVAAELAAEEINADGGINGRDIELVIKDSAGEPDQAISVTRELIEREEVVAIVGPGLTTTAEAAFPLANQAEVPAISPTIVSPTAAPKNRPWTFTIGAPADILFEANFPNIEAEYPDVKRLVLVVDPECAGCVNEATFMADYLEDQGYEIPNKGAPIAVQAGAPDLGAQATAVADLDPDAIVGSAGPSEWARLAKELDRRGLAIPAFSGTGPSAPLFLDEAGEAGNGWTVLSGFWADSPDETVQAFVEEMQPRLEEAGRPEGAIIGPDAQYYDAVKIMAKALEDADLSGSESVEEVRVAVRKGIEGLSDYVGVTGEMSMQENGRMKVTGFTLIARDGAFERLEA